MSTQNPFQDDSRAELWELGYLSGFNDPATLPDAVPDPADVFQSGFDSGAADRQQDPVEGHSWLESIVEFVAEESLLHAVGAGIEKVGIEAGGVIGLVLSVVMIPGDVMLKPMADDYQAPANREGDSYVPLCPRKDHGMVIDGVTPDGFWVGPAGNDFAAAVAACQAHGHSAAFVAMCAPNDGACGPVWPITR